MIHTDSLDRLGSPARMRRIAGYDLAHDTLKIHLDDIAACTADRLRAPVCLISVLLERSQRILGSYGVPERLDLSAGVPAEWSVCTRTVLAGRPYCVADTTADPAHADNPVLAEAGLRCYAGVPLIDGSGEVLGAHCVFDVRPRTFTEDDIAMLLEDARETMQLLTDYPAVRNAG